MVETTSSFQIPCKSCKRLCEVSPFVYEVFLESPRYKDNFVCRNCADLMKPERVVLVKKDSITNSIDITKPSVDAETGRLVRICPKCKRLIYHRGKYADIACKYAIKKNRLCRHCSKRNPHSQFDKISIDIFYNEILKKWCRFCPICEKMLCYYHKRAAVLSAKHKRNCQSCGAKHKKKKATEI